MRSCVYNASPISPKARSVLTPSPPLSVSFSLSRVLQGAMEGSSSSAPAPPPDSTLPPSSGASKYLANLPSRGFLSSTVLTSNPGGMRVYVCDHDTSPREDQLIKTNSTNILIRALTLKRSKADSGLKDAKAVTAADGTRKRAAEKVLDGRAASKRPMNNAQTGTRQEGTNARSLNYHGLTVERLRALLKERGLSLKGKKDELIARLKGGSG